ncbi:MAG: glycoside hydrolase family 127 protein [Opitutaceae bacterium]|nr:glycoside hydrolase family 127 protein [Opitutaceae bacterium]
MIPASVSSSSGFVLVRLALRVVAAWLFFLVMAPGWAADYSFTVAPDGVGLVVSPDGGRAVFAPVFAVLHAEKNPNLTTRFGKFRDRGLTGEDTGSAYHVLTWGAASVAAKNTGHVADGFDPDADRGYGAERTANLFEAGRLVYLRASAARAEGGGGGDGGGASGGGGVRRVTWVFPENDLVALEAVLELSGDGTAPSLTFSARVKQAGWWSFGYAGAPACAPDELDELWQPLIYTERRFPEDAYLEPAFRCPLATTLVSRGGVTVGVMADPAEFPFQPLPNLGNSRFGVALRNQAGRAQPMLFAPVLGGAGSRLARDGAFAFTSRLIVSGKALSATVEEQARRVYGFADIRHNVLGSLNTAFENTVAYGLSEYARFNRELRGFAYDTDVPGSVKNVSALHPLSVALVTDSREIYENLVYPQVEYFISRERFLYSIHLDAKGQGVSTRLGGDGAPLNEYATLYAMTGRRAPFLLQIAEKLQPQTRSINLNAQLRGEFWANSLALHRATGDKKWLERAVRDADDYLKKRVLTRQRTFDDPDSRGMFFWTSYAAQWIELYELYEETGEKRFLDAARDGARIYAQFTHMAPRIPGGDVTVNEDGHAPSYRKSSKQRHYTRIQIAPETVPAWQVSEIGLTPESSVTSRGHRGILLACYAPWMLRIAERTGDAFLHDIARSAIIGRYTTFPGYHLNTARTTAYQKPDFPERPLHELNSTTSLHYNHIWPHIAMLLDYLVADAFEKSRGQVDFPGRYAEGYAYLQQKIYGDRPGKIFGEENLWLWMPRGVVTVTHPELNYITARGENSFHIALTNQSKQRVSAQVRLNPALVPWPANVKTVTVESRDASGRKTAGTLNTAGSAGVDVEPEGLTVVSFRGVTPQIGFQREMVGAGGPRLPVSGSHCELGWRGARAVGLLLGPNEPARIYTYIPDNDREIARCTLNYRQGGGAVAQAEDASYPFEYTVPTKGFEPVELWFEVELKNGNKEKSPAGQILLK